MLAVASSPLGPGPTGEFPEGKLVPSDEGELRIGLKIHEGKVVLAFGKEVGWVAMGPELAEQLGRRLLELSARARGPVIVRPVGF